MKLELETNPSAFPFIDNDFVNNSPSENSSEELKPLLQRGIKAAKEGNRVEAKQLLLRVVEAEPSNEDALMWLASISEYPEELLGYLDNILRFNPNNVRASDWAKSTKSLLAKDFLQRGIEASKNSQKEFARQNFLQAVAHDNDNETAWLWLASVSDSVEDKNKYLRKVLNLNPENENALLMLKSVKNQNVELLFVKAVTEAVSNKRNQAKETLETVLKDAPGLEDAWILKSFLSDSFNEKISCYEKILELNSESPLANVNWTALLEIMARAESGATNENAEQLSADTAANENQAEDFYSQKVSDEMPELEQNSDEVPEFEQSKEFDFVAEEKKSDFVVEKVDSPELSSQSADFMPDLSVEESYFTKKNSVFDEVKFEENPQDYSEMRREEQSEPDIAVYYNSPADEDDSILSLQYQVEEKEENPFEMKAANENFDKAETLEVLDEFPGYSFDADVKQQRDSEPEDNSVSYYETDEPLFTPAAAETDYSQPFEEDAQSNFDQPDLLDEEDFTAPKKQNLEEEFVLEIQENEPENVSKSASELVTCPFCKSKNEPQAFVCNSCHTMLTLSDMEMLLAHQGVDKHTLQYAVEEMEAASEQYDFDAEEFRMLGIGHINLKNFRLGFAYLQDALKLNPNNVVLSSQVNALAIRLAEMDRQESIHSSTPKNRKILVVDDSATVRRLIAGKLEKSGHEVLCAMDGIEALEKINEIMPDLILLDINMPRMDGYQVCKLIRNNEATKDVPVVMISGKDGFFDKVRGRMAGTTGYITKPFGPETLMKTVETYIV